MLLDFSFTNFRTFYNEQNLSMIAADRIKEFEHYLIKKKDYAVLPSAIIYGPNASGKSNIYKAMALLRLAVLVGNINEKGIFYFNLLELMSFIHDKEKHDQPTEFNISFVFDKHECFYKLSFISFIEEERNFNDTAIVKEELLVDGILLFSRKYNNIELNKSMLAIKKYEEFGDILTTKELISYEKAANKNAERLQLYIRNGFRNTICKNLALEIIAWFALDFKLFDSYNDMKYDNVLFESRNKEIKEDTIIKSDFWDVFSKKADFGPQDLYLALDKSSDSNDLSLYSSYHIKGLGRLEFPSDFMESRGTQNIHRLGNEILEVLDRGSTLVIDEIDSSIHPDLMASVINVFNHSSINRNGAQLIMTTHNPVLMEHFRRDQIYFIDKDKDTFESELYSLYDFKTESGDKVRKDAKYMKNYMNGNYGAIPDADFAGAIKEIMNKNTDEVEDKDASKEQAETN